MKKYIPYWIIVILLIVIVYWYVYIQNISNIQENKEPQKQSYLQQNIECQKMLEEYKGDIGWANYTIWDVNVIYSPMIDSCIGYYEEYSISSVNSDYRYHIKDLFSTKFAEFSYRENISDMMWWPSKNCNGMSNFNTGYYDYSSECSEYAVASDRRNVIEYLKWV